MPEIGNFISRLGIIAWVVFGIWGFLLSLAVVTEVAGFWGTVVGFSLLPVTFAAAPLYAGIAWGDWFPLLICYGGGIASTILMAVGSSISDD